MRIRIADPKDAEGILAIYAPYIRETSFTFETTVPTLEQFAQRIETTLRKFPWLVCEHEGIIAGYAYAMRHREREAYQWSVETSVYVHDDFFRSGAGTALYTSLIALLSAQGFNNAYAVINLPNEKSVRFHEKSGYSYFTTFEKVGYKLGRWKNVGWWQLQLNEYNDAPADPLPFEQLDTTVVSFALQKGGALLTHHPGS